MGKREVKSFIRHFFLLSTIYYLLSTISYARVYIDINKPGQEKIPIAIPEFMMEGKGADEIAQKMLGVLKNDLEFTGLFEILPPETFLEKSIKDDIDFKKWYLIGAHLLVKGGIKTDDNMVEAELSLYDVKLGRRLVGKKYYGKQGQCRYIVHKYADEIMKALTGEPGIFQTKIAFVHGSSGNKEIYLMDFDGYNVQPLTQLNTISLSPTWHPEGDKLLFTSYKGKRPEVYLLELRSGQIKRLIRYPGINIAPAFSPDGKDIAVTLNKRGKQGIYLVDKRGDIKKCLVEHWGINVSASFSPDGKKIAFVSDRGGSPQIYTLGLNTGSINRLTFEGSYNTSPVWSLKGDYIAYTGIVDGHFQIFMIEPNGNNLRQLTYDKVNHESPSFSPDGHFLAFSQQGKIYVLRLFDGHSFPISGVLDMQTQPRWSPRLIKKIERR